MRKFGKNWWVFGLLSLTLGLAPFSPEPHLFGKLRWVAGGADGMTAMDWFDLALHGTPWILFLMSAGVEIKFWFENRHSSAQ